MSRLNISDNGEWHLIVHCIFMWTLFVGKLNTDVHVMFVLVQPSFNKHKSNYPPLVLGFEMDLIRILEKMSSNKALKYLNLGQNMRQR